MKITEKRSKFAYNVSELIRYAFICGFEVVLGEAQRLPDVQLLYYHNMRIQGDKDNIKLVKVDKTNTTTLNSKHIDLLAIDLEFFKDGIWINGLPTEKAKEIIAPIGEYWESLSTECKWGGNFSKLIDVPHFQMY